MKEEKVERLGKVFVGIAAGHVTQSPVKIHVDWTMGWGLQVPTLSMQVYRDFASSSPASESSLLLPCGLLFT